MARKYRFTFVGRAELAEGEVQVIEAHGNTRTSAERLARARLRDQTRRDSSLYATQRVDFVPESEART